MKNSDQPINALSEETTDRVDAGVKIYTGLTKREYAAIMAMQGIVAGITSHDKETTVVQNKVWAKAYGSDENQATCAAKEAVKYADALLAELEKEQK